MKLSYKAAGEDGKIIRGEIDAKSQIEAAAFLRSKQLTPISIEKKPEKSFLKSLPFINKSTSKDRVFFTRQTSSMLTAGLTLMQALTILKDQTQSSTMKIVIAGLIMNIEEGRSFSLALQRYPNLFSPVYVSLIKAAETSGLLDTVMLKLADNLEKQERLKQTLKSALMYPSIVFLAMIGVIFVMMTFVVPQLSTLYESLNIKLPLSTRIIIGLSKFSVTFWPFIFAIVGIIGVLFLRWKKTESGEQMIDNLLLRFPLFGKLIQQSILAEFTRTFGLLIGAGTLVVESLNETAGIAGNVHYKEAITDVAKRVERGVTVGDALSFSPLFPPMVVEMVKIGEQTGKMDESLARVSEYYEREVEMSVKSLTTAMEPIIIVILGVGVAFLIFSIITPIYKLTNAI